MSGAKAKRNPRAGKQKTRQGQATKTGQGQDMGRLTGWQNAGQLSGPKSYKWRPESSREESSGRRQINHSETKQFRSSPQRPKIHKNTNQNRYPNQNRIRIQT
ncbi:uncharacterized protein DMAD_08046 [Drosophila madeirensis]|uniref:Uncharacterized protein n=1 Tax=Drosophila madeirensis TaxID=30013 RepID=A0AAU9ESQ0_DROMD